MPAPHPEHNVAISMLGQIELELVRLLDSLQKNPKGPIYHYTNARGLEGILKSRSLYASHWMYLNDHREFIHGLELAKQIAEELADDLVARNLAEHIRITIENASKSEILDPTSAEASESHLFLSCFCEKGDLLSQWRAYGQQGEGYAIGLRPLNPESPTQAEKYRKPEIYLRKVIYDSREKRRLMKELIEIFLKNAIEYLTSLEVRIEAENTWFSTQKLRPQNYTAMISSSYRSKMFRGLLRASLILSACFKDSGFEEEQEWRLFFFENKAEICIRESNNNLLPYVTVPFDSEGNKPFELQSIVYGPRLDPKLAAFSLDRLLHKNGLKNVEIQASKIPFR